MCEDIFSPLYMKNILVENGRSCLNLKRIHLEWNHISYWRQTALAWKSQNYKNDLEYTSIALDFVYFCLLYISWSVYT